MSLGALRKRIDGLDESILGLLEERARAALEVAAEKEKLGLASFYDPERERRVVDRLVASSRGVLPEAALRAVYREIIAACLALQRPLSVAFLGPEGTFSQAAARQLFGDAALYVEAATIEGVFDAAARGEVSRGVVPVENSSEGSVAATARALLAGELRIEREWILDVHHCLLSRAGALPAVRRVYSHPQALAQCARWLRQSLPEARIVEVASTAAAAREAAADPEGGAVGGALAGELHGLPALARGIEDLRGNATRFLVIAETDSAPSGDDKTTLAFELEDRKGALRAALGAFEDEGVNLLRIESQPSRVRAFSYVFVCDMEGHREDPAPARALAKLEGLATRVKLLGSYPRHRR